MKYALIAFATLFASTSAVHATEAELAKSNLAHDYANCAAFYHVASHLSGLDGKLRHEYQEAEAAALRHSTLLTSRPVALARYKMALQTVTRDDNPDLMLTTAYTDYGYLCEDLMQQPNKRMQYWREKVADRRGG